MSAVLSSVKSKAKLLPINLQPRDFLWLFPSATQRNTEVPAAGHSMASNPSWLPLPASSAADIVQPLPYLDKQFPNYLEYTEVDIFTHYLKETATDEDDFAAQLLAYPVIDGINVLSAINLSLIPLQQLELPEPLSRFTTDAIFLPRELRFWVLTRGGLPYELYNSDDLAIINYYPNLFPAWKQQPDRVAKYIAATGSASQTNQLTNQLTSLIPEEVSAYFFDPTTDSDKLLPDEIIIPYKKEEFISWQNWVQTNNEIVKSRRLAHSNPALAANLQSVNLTMANN